MKNIFTILFVLITALVSAQNYQEALLFSQQYYGGTARSTSMGNAFGAVGADFISSSINPAGMGLYIKDEITFTPTLEIFGTEANYFDESKSDARYNFNFNNIGWVSVSDLKKSTGITSLTFSLGINRLHNFNQNMIVGDTDVEHSLLNYFTDYANQIGDPGAFDEFNEGLAWDTYLINEDPNPDVVEGIYYNSLQRYEEENNNGLISYIPVGNVPVSQLKSVQRSGRIDEFTVSVATNFDYKLYVGATMGISNLDYREYFNYKEYDPVWGAVDFDQRLNSFTYDGLVDIWGYGVNFKLGAIYRPTKSLRIGAAIHTPTFYSLSQEYENSLTANYNEAIGDDDMGYYTQWTDNSRIGYSEYKLETPLRAVFSAAYTIGKRGIISADYEIVNYSNIKYRNPSEGGDFTFENNVINSAYKGANNLRIGGELRATQTVSFRAGYELYGNPWKKTYNGDNYSFDQPEINNTYSTYAAGIGFRKSSFYFDLAYKLTTVNEKYELYPGSPYADLSKLNHKIMCTLGFRF